MPTKYEFYTDADTWNGSFTWDDNWNTQTFTPSVSHFITSVKLKLYRVNTPGIITVSIQRVDGSRHPDGTDLTSATFDGNSLGTSPDGLVEIPLTSYALIVATEYAIVLKALDADGSDYVRWRGANGSYAGRAWYTLNGGSTWLSEGTNSDYIFEVWGNPLGHRYSQAHLIG